MEIRSIVVVLLAWIVLTGFVATAVARADEGEQVARYEASQRAMGSLFTIVLYAKGDAEARRAFEAAFGRIRQLDDILSDYDPASELSRLSAASPTEQPVQVSDDLWRVLVEAHRVSQASAGAFDVSVGPLTTLWRKSRKEQAMPPSDELQRALAAVGFRHVKLSDGQTVSLARPNMRLDLGGIAKGYAVDEALDAIRQQGITQALVNGGGDIGMTDAPPGRTGWKIGVAPLERNAQPSLFLSLTNCAVATSGDAWQFVEIDGRRYSHIVDPKTGLGLTERSSVTLVAPNCTQADALASAVSVLGVERGLERIEQQANTEVFFVRQRDEKTVTAQSSGFEKLPRAK